MRYPEDIYELAHLHGLDSVDVPLAIEGGLMDFHPAERADVRRFLAEAKAR